MKTVRKLLVLSAAVASMAVLSGCKKTEQKDKATEPDYSVYVDKKAHYLVFYVESQVLDKMLTTPDDTYDSLEPYFPTIPEKEGYVGAWEKDVKVYQEKVKEVAINAYYTKIA